MYIYSNCLAQLQNSDQDFKNVGIIYEKGKFIGIVARDFLHYCSFSCGVLEPCLEKAIPIQINNPLSIISLLISPLPQGILGFDILTAIE